MVWWIFAEHAGLLFVGQLISARGCLASFLYSISGPQVAPIILRLLLLSLGVSIVLQLGRDILQVQL